MKELKLNISLYLRYCAETCNELAGLISTLLRFWQHSSFWKRSQWRADGNTPFDLTRPRFESPTFCFKEERVTAWPTKVIQSCKSAWVDKTLACQTLLATKFNVAVTVNHLYNVQYRQAEKQNLCKHTMQFTCSLIYLKKLKFNILNKLRHACGVMYDSVVLN